MQYIRGNLIAKNILQKIKDRVSTFERAPKLGIIKVGHDEATDIYIRHKITDAQKVGIKTEVFEFESIEVDRLAELLHELNERRDLDGYIIQLPFQIRGDLKSILHLINPNKDVDGLNPLSLGATWQSREDIGFLPATVLGIKEALKHVVIFDNNQFDGEETNADNVELAYREYLKGKNIVIINDSLIVGRPLAGMLLNYGATISICHKETKDIAQYTSKADILISATGRVGLINAEMIKANAVLIDVGIKRVGNKIMGDIDEKSVKAKATWLTPVPNGIGPLTRAMLLQNVMEAYLRQLKSSPLL